MEATSQLNQLSSLGPGPGKSQTNRVSIQIPQKYQSCYYNLHETSTLDFLEVEDQSKRRILSMVQVLLLISYVLPVIFLSLWEIANEKLLSLILLKIFWSRTLDGEEEFVQLYLKLC